MYTMTVYMTILFRQIPTPHPYLDLPIYAYTGIKSTRTLTNPYPGQGKSTHTHNGEVSSKAVTWLRVDPRLTRGEFNSYPGPIFNYHSSSTKYYSVFFHTIWQNRWVPYPYFDTNNKKDKHCKHSLFIILQYVYRCVFFKKIIITFLIKPNYAIKNKCIIVFNIFRLLKLRHKITSFVHRVVHFMHDM